jgi:hypothetical protein
MDEEAAQCAWEIDSLHGRTNCACWACVHIDDVRMQEGHIVQGYTIHSVHHAVLVQTIFSQWYTDCERRNNCTLSNSVVMTKLTEPPSSSYECPSSFIPIIYFANDDSPNLGTWVCIGSKSVVYVLSMWKLYKDLTQVQTCLPIIWHYTISGLAWTITCCECSYSERD